MFAQGDLINETTKLRKFALRLTKNKADADDLLQSTCLRTLEKADYFKEGTNLFHWASKIMYNLFVSDYRHKTKFESRYDPEPILHKQTEGPAQQIQAEFADVTRAMMKLSVKHREILVMVCVKGMSYQEVSNQLRMPVGTVRSRLFRARKQLEIIMDTPSWAYVHAKGSENADISAMPAYIASRVLQRNAVR